MQFDVHSALVGRPKFLTLCHSHVMLPVGLIVNTGGNLTHGGGFVTLSWWAATSLPGHIIDRVNRENGSVSVSGDENFQPELVVQVYQARDDSVTC